MFIMSSIHCGTCLTKNFKIALIPVQSIELMIEVIMVADRQVMLRQRMTENSPEKK